MVAFGVSSEEDRFLYEDLIAGAANRLVQHGKTQNARFTELVKTSINSLCDLLIVELRLQRPSCFLLIKALSPIFAYQKPFYNQHYQKIMSSQQPASQASGTGVTSAGSSVANNAKADLSKLTKEDIEWRQGLVRGEHIDAVFHDLRFSLESWVKAEVGDVMGDIDKPNLGDEQGNNLKRFDVKYRDHEGTKLYRADSLLIAPYNKMTKNDQWRQNLQVGDQCDFYDKYMQWDTVTVVDKEDKRDNPKLTLGFRKYKHDGDREDHLGRFEGRAQIYDDECELNSIRIQKAYSMVEIQKGGQEPDPFNAPCWRFKAEHSLPNLHIDVSKVQTVMSGTAGSGGTQ